MDRPLRVALFSGNFNYVRDGANQALNRLVAHAQHAGMVLKVYSPTTATPAFPPAGPLVSVPSVPIPGRAEFRLALGLPRRLQTDLAAFAPDIVHLSAPDILGVAALRWARRNRVPTVTSLHTRFETYSAFYGLGWVRQRIERHLAGFYGRSDYVLAPTAAIVDELTEARGDGRVRLWSRGVEQDDFSPARRDLPWRRSLGYADEAPVLLFFGRLVREKGIDRFIEVVRALDATLPGLRPLIVGAGPEHGHFQQALPQAVFTGHLDGPELWRAIASSDILLNPSITEAFGNVVLEAMAAGVAVVSADTPSARQLLRDGETGLLCAPESCDAYAAAVRMQVAAPARRAAMGAAARRASSAYRWDETLDAVLDVYREAHESAPQARPSATG